MLAISNFIKSNSLTQIMYCAPNLENGIQNLPDSSSNIAVLWQILDFFPILDTLRQNLQNLKIYLQQNQYVKAESRIWPESGAQTNLEFWLTQNSIVINTLMQFADFVSNLWKNLGFCIINQYIRLNSRYDITHPIPVAIGIRNGEMRCIKV